MIASSELGSNCFKLYQNIIKIILNKMYLLEMGETKMKRE